MRHFFQQLFSFSRREKQGIYVLVSLIFLLIGFRYFYLPSQHYGKEFDHSAFKKEISSFENSLVKKKEKTAEYSNTIQGVDKSETTIKQELFHFNPNELDKDGWEKLGLSKRIIAIIGNYRESGGKFYKKEDLKKIYGLGQDLYSTLEPYIDLPEKSQPSENTQTSESNIKKKENYARKDTVINLNKADTFNLLLVHGIGPYYAKRICKYRSLLGGFSKIEQLKEVYGINDTVYNMINNSLKIDTSEIRKIKLNNATFKELIRHPYISAYQTKAILKYISYKDTIQTTKELLENNILDEQTFNKVSIYIEP